MKILIINSGSATLKFKIFDSVALKEQIIGIIERIGLEDSFLELKEKGSRNFFKQNFPGGIKNHEAAFSEMAKSLKKFLPEIGHIGHRVVHGGEEFNSTVRLNHVVIGKLAKYNELAPLHNPINLCCIKKSWDLFPQIDQYAIFDTAYYRTLPDYVFKYALPEELYKEYGIRRYGFHGISHEYAAVEGARKAKKNFLKSKIITCHLGGGCSMTAAKDGQAVGTTMGFTPLEGLMMSTRSGDIDPSIPLFLISRGLSPEEVDEILNKKSGLLGVAGTRDMREILSAAGEKVVGYKPEKKFSSTEKEKSKLALKMFVYNIVRYVGQFKAVMKGLDLLVFTGGIGERSPALRNLVLKEVKSLGKFKSIVVNANEELMMAKEIKKVMK